MIPARAQFEGFEGHCLAYSGENLELLLPRAYAPGAPLQFVLDGPNGEAIPLFGRTLGSKRREDGSFHVRLRLTNLSRHARLALAKLSADR